MTRRPVRTGGFTLLEILLALSVLSIILLLLLSAFTGAARVRETIYTRAREFRQIRLVLDDEQSGSANRLRFCGHSHGRPRVQLARPI